jgi:hypothetical protein
MYQLYDPLKIRTVCEYDDSYKETKGETIYKIKIDLFLLWELA